MILASLSIGPTFEGRRRRGKDSCCALDRGPQHGHVARVVQHLFFLFERPLMFLIHHDQAEIRIGQKQCGTRTDDQLRIPRSCRMPASATFGWSDPMVPLGRAGAKAGLDPVEECRGQGDLRQQHQCLASLCDAGGNGFHVDFGLAGAGDAINQRGREGLRLHTCAQRMGRGELLVGEMPTHLVSKEGRIGQIGLDLLGSQRARIGKSLDDSRADTRLASQIGRRQLRTTEMFQHAQDAFTRCCHPFGNSRPPSQDPAGLGGAAKLGNPRGQTQHHPGRAHGVACRAVEEPLHWSTHGR